MTETDPEYFIEQRIAAAVAIAGLECYKKGVTDCLDKCLGVIEEHCCPECTEIRKLQVKMVERVRLNVYGRDQHDLERTRDKDSS